MPVNVSWACWVDTNPWAEGAGLQRAPAAADAVAGDIAHDSAKIFALTRNTEQGDTPRSRAGSSSSATPTTRPALTRHGWNSANKVFAKAGGGGHTRVLHWKADIALRYYQLHGGVHARSGLPVRAAGRDRRDLHPSGGRRDSGPAAGLPC